MLLSRFWYLLLALAAAGGLAVAMLGTSLLNEQLDEAARDSLRRDRFELEATLKLEARTRIDALAPLAAHGDVRSALREASGRQAGAEVPEAVRTRLHARLGELNTQLAEMAGDLVFAVDQHGIIVAQVGGQAPPAGAGLGSFPLVRRALDGHVRDDVWVYNGEVFRMAARPVVEGGQYVGAIVHGKRIDDSFASRLATRLGGASIAFFYREQVFASAMPPDVQGAPRGSDIGAPHAQALAMQELQDGERTPPVELPTGGLAVYSLVTGSAAYAQVGYAVARPVTLLGSPTAIIERASGADWAALPWPLLGGAAFVLFLLSMLFVWLEHDRPIGKFRAAAARLGKREIDRFTPPEFGGGLRASAVSVNEALDKVQETSAQQAPKRKANLDEILGPVGQEPQGPAFFGFAGQQQSSAADIPPAPPAAASPVLPAMTPSPAPLPKPPEPAAKVEAPKPPSPPGPPPAAKVPPPPAAKPAPPKPAAPPAPALGSTLIGMPAEPAAGGTGPVQAVARKPATMPPAMEEDDDGATMVARVPDELLKKTAAETGAGESDADLEAHFREVYQQFVDTKKQCGEPVAGLTYDKFVVTLKKNREQIVKRHDAQKVRFTVYVKDGKAALKATPIRD